MVTILAIPRRTIAAASSGSAYAAAHRYFDVAAGLSLHRSAE
jgi:hypothetical protein